MEKTLRFSGKNARSGVHKFDAGTGIKVSLFVLKPNSKLYKFRASGHVDRFTDWMVRDSVTTECYRADHLIKNQAEVLLKVRVR